MRDINAILAELKAAVDAADTEHKTASAASTALADELERARAKHDQLRDKRRAAVGNPGKRKSTATLDRDRSS